MVYSSRNDLFGVGGWGLGERSELPLRTPLIQVNSPPFNCFLIVQYFFSHFCSSAAFCSLFCLSALPLSPFSHSRLTPITTAAQRTMRPVTQTSVHV